MTKYLVKNLFFFLWIATVAVAQPTITQLSATKLPRSSRVIIQGSGFGATQGSGHVEIAGVSAPLTRWSDTLIAAYVPESAPTGTGNVQVFTSAGSSNVVSLEVTLRSGQAGHIRWRFQADGDYIQSRPTVGKNGTVYTQDLYGHLYAISPTGGLKWIFNAPGTGHGCVSVGPDGTVYVANTESVFALTPNGTLRWKFDQTPGARNILGPNVGPDGNIYVVGVEGLGVFSITPQGSLRWSVPESYHRPPSTLQEIVFGPSGAGLYFHANDHLRGLGLDGNELFTFVDHLDLQEGNQQPAVGPDGSVYSNLFTYPGPGLVLGKFDPKGNELWYVFDQFSPPTSAMTTPDVGPDGTVYDGRNLAELYAIRPDGSVKWKYVDPGILFAPAVSPLNNLVFVGGVVDYGQPGFFEALSAAGRSLGTVLLPAENGGLVIPMSRPRFTPDGRTVYIGTSIPGQLQDNPYSYLYSVAIR